MPVTREAFRFDDEESALEAARTAAPLDVLFQIDSRKEGSTVHIPSAGALRLELDRRRFSVLRKDVLWLWLPVARPDAYIFDHDGVIADTQGLHAAIESQMLAAFGIDITAEEITRRYSGVSMRVMFPELFADRGKEPPNVEQLVEEKYRLIMKSIDQVRPIDGTIHLIRRIHAEGVPMAVGSASRKLFLDAVLQKLGIERMFRAIATGHEVPHGKPAPDIFLLAAKRLDIEPRKCVVVEDSYHGMEAAKRAGMKCIALDNGTQPHIDADWVFKDLRYLDLDAIRI